MAHGLSCSVACGILVLGPGIEPMFLALPGGFLTTGPPEKSLGLIFKCRFYFYFSIVRPTGQKMIAIETMVCYSQFPKGGGMPHYPGSRGDTVLYGSVDWLVLRRQSLQISKAASCPSIRMKRHGIQAYLSLNTYCHV